MNQCTLYDSYVHIFEHKFLADFMAHFSLSNGDWNFHEIIKANDFFLFGDA